jgi:peroxin-7
MSLKIWDLRKPASTMTIQAHAYEVLTADWCKYNDCLVATGSVDKSIKVWDLRRPDKEVLVLYGHG